jgi:hypothetical protein
MSDGKTGETKNYSEAIATRLTPQTKDNFEEYREANQLGSTEAARRLIRTSLDDDEAERRRPVRNLAAAFGLLYVTIWYLGNRESLYAISAVFIIVMLAWSLYPDYQQLRDNG